MQERHKVSMNILVVGKDYRLMTPPCLPYAEVSAGPRQEQRKGPLFLPLRNFQTNSGIGQMLKVTTNHTAGHKLKVKLGSSLHHEIAFLYLEPLMLVLTDPYFHLLLMDKSNFLIRL